MTRLKFKDFLLDEEAPSADETLTPGPVRSIRDYDHEKELLKNRQVSPVYKDDKIEVLKLRGRDAAIYYGSGTHWGHDVRVNEKYFDDFIKSNDPHLILTIKGRKYLVYPKEHEVYNEAFKEINAYELVKKHPEMRHPFEELAEKHKWPAFLKREPNDEDLEQVKKTRKLHHMDAEDFPSATTAANIESQRQGLDAIKELLEKISYEKALDILKHSDYASYTRAFLTYYHSKRGRLPIKDAYEAVKDEKDKLKTLAEVVLNSDDLHQLLKMSEEVEVGLIQAMGAYDLDKVLKNMARGLIKFSAAGWEKVVEIAPDKVLELHKSDKSVVPQKYLQRAQWQFFKKNR